MRAWHSCGWITKDLSGQGLCAPLRPHPSHRTQDLLAQGGVGSRTFWEEEGRGAGSPQVGPLRWPLQMRTHGSLQKLPSWYPWA